MSDLVFKWQIFKFRRLLYPYPRNYLKATFEIRERTDKQKNKQQDRNTLLTCRGRSDYSFDLEE